MRRVKEGTVISGPSLLVDEILRVFDAPNLNTLVSTIWDNELSALRIADSINPTSCMYLVENKRYSGDGKMYSSPRVGLDLSNANTKASPTDPRVAFVGKSHRFFRHPELLMKNGRLQTFVGLLRQLKRERTTEASIAPLLAAMGNFTEQSIEKYTAEFRWGESSGRLQHFIDLGGKTTAATPANYLRLMGTLHRMYII
jgi:hypothetical protein